MAYYPINRIFPANPPLTNPGARLAFTPLSSISESQKALFGISRGVRLVLLQRDWDNHLPSPIRENTYPGALSSEGIIIRTSRPVWQRQCTFLLPEIREALETLAPDLAHLPLLIRLEKPFLKPVFRKAPPFVVSEEILDKAREIANLAEDPLIRRGCYPLILRSLLTASHLAGQKGSDRQ